MTGDDRHLTLIADRAQISAYSPDPSAPPFNRGIGRQAMRERDARAFNGYFLRELTIESVTSCNWDSLSEGSPTHVTKDFRRPSQGAGGSVGLSSQSTPVKSPLRTLILDSNSEYDSVYNACDDESKQTEPDFLNSEVYTKSTACLNDHNVLLNTMSSAGTMHTNIRNETRSPSVISISSKICQSECASPASFSPDEGVTSKSKSATLLTALRGKKPTALGNILNFHKELTGQTKAVKFQSFMNSKSESNSRTIIDSLNNLNQISKQSILKNGSPSNVTEDAADYNVKGDSQTFPQKEVVDRSIDKGTQQLSKLGQDASEEGDVNADVAVRTGLCRCANLSTQKGRRNHALMIMLVSVIPVIALLIQNSINVYSHSLDLKQHNGVKGEILFSVEIGNVLHRTQIERGTTALYVSSKGDRTILQNLTTAYQETDKVMASLTRWVVEPSISYFRSVGTYHDRLKDFRGQVMSSSVPNVTVQEVIKFYSDDNAVIVRWVGQFIQHSKSGDLWKTLVGYYMLILSKEQAGVERALGSTFYAKGGYDDQEMLDYLERKILGMTYLERCTEYSSTVNVLLKNVFVGKETDVFLMNMRAEILRNSLNGSDVAMGARWFNNMTKYINILKVRFS